MIDFLFKVFIKSYENGKSQSDREKCGVFSSIVGLLVNILLAAFKLLAGVISGSIAIVADALNNFSDAGSSIISFISFKISAKPADRDHPFGHARFEYVSSMIVSFLILLVGFELLVESVGGFFDPSSTGVTISALTIIILSVSILAKLLLGAFYLGVARRIDSTVIKASATDSFSDAASTAAVLASMIVIYFTDWVLIDSIVGTGVSVLIIIAGIKILNETKNSLLGEAPVDEVVNDIRAIVAEHPEIIGIHDLLVHNYGPKNYIASLHAEVDGDRDIFVLHDMIDNVEREINQRLGILCTIHMDPIVTNDEAVSELKRFTEEKVRSVVENAGIHDFRTVVGNTHTNLIFDVELPFEYKGNIKEIEKKIEAEVQKEHPECFCVITVDRS